ncbi:MAG: helix-turn-helix domain-containing protein [Patescibacteria group bacterium]|nr:helix-turn-helix domain-containing protein [Patescibacteria group bacterium]
MPRKNPPKRTTPPAPLLRPDIRTDRDPALLEAMAAVGSISHLARLVRRGQSTVSQWNRVPWDMVMTVEKVTGIPRWRLRPDIYPPEREKEK